MCKNGTGRLGRRWWLTGLGKAPQEKLRSRTVVSGVVVDDSRPVVKCCMVVVAPRVVEPAHAKVRMCRGSSGLLVVMRIET